MVRALIASMFFASCGLLHTQLEGADSGSATDGGPSAGSGCVPGERVRRIDLPSGEPGRGPVTGIAFDSAGQLYAASGSMLGFFDASPEHVWKRSLLFDASVAVLDVAVLGQGEVAAMSVDFSIENQRTRVRQLKVDSGQYFNFDTAPASDKSLENGGGIAAEADGALVVSVGLPIRFRAGNGTDVLGAHGFNTGQISIPAGVAVDPSTGNIWVADPGRNVIHELTPAGASVFELGSRGAGEGQFDGQLKDSERQCPARVALDGRRGLYADDASSFRVLKFSTSGEPLGELSFPSGAKDIYSVAVEPSTGWVYVGRNGFIDVMCPLP